MALPEANTPWPPAPWDEAYTAYAENEAWYLGDVDKLSRLYSRTEQQRPSHARNGQLMTGGVVGMASRFFWGRPVPHGQSRTRIHVPAAADLATLSSDLIFSEPPEVKLTGEGESKAPQKAQDRLDEIANSDAAHAMYNTMGELKAALGATVITTEWDTEIADHAWLACNAVDVVIPTFRKGKLVACIMWSEFVQGQVYYRHLESHEPGRIEHALYEGTSNNIGRRVPLTERPETLHLAKLVDGDSAILTGIDRLTASYNLNMPTRAWRKKGQLAFAGRSDFAGLHPLFDGLDEAFSSWMRDLKLAGAKLFVPESLLQSGGAGTGAFFDLQQEAFVGLNAPASADQNMQTMMRAEQFDIRVEEHERTVFALYREILRAAGYSPSAWGEHVAEGQVTATQVEDRNKASERTRDKKTLYDKAAIAEQSAVALEIDGLVFPGKGGGRFDKPRVEFPDVSQVDPEKLASTIQMLHFAEAISQRRKVELANPDWDEEQVGAEVDAIRADLDAKRATVPDPAVFTGDPDEDDLNEE